MFVFVLLIAFPMSAQYGPPVVIQRFGEVASCEVFLSELKAKSKQSNKWEFSCVKGQSAIAIR